MLTSRAETGAAGAAGGRSWGIAAAMLPFPGVDPSSGARVQDADPQVWAAHLQAVAAVGFTEVDLTDSWLKPGNLSAARLADLGVALKDSGLRPSAISAIRCSVIDPTDAAENLAYSHRTIDAAAELAVPMVSLGLHRPLTPQQQEAFWFWTVPGAKDDRTNRDAWQRAVTRLRELAGHGAEVGVALSLEMYEDTFLGTADSAVSLLTDINHSNCGLNPDLGNLVRLQRPVEAWEQLVEKTLPHATYWHVKNYTRAEDPVTGMVLTSPTSMELGVINYRWAVEFALSVGYRGDFCVEHYGGDSLGVSAMNRDYLRRLLPRDAPVSDGPR